MWKKLLILLLAIIVTPIIAGAYGVVHDEFTYTISQEYFTKFKFYQFGLFDSDNAGPVPNPRQFVAIVGFFATWWVGLIIGIIFGLTGLMQKDYKTMLYTITRCVTVTLSITFTAGIIGLAFGWFYLSNTNVNWWFPADLTDKKSFIAVGSMHNFGYMGGLIGLLAGIIYQVRHSKKQKKYTATLLTYETTI